MVPGNPSCLGGCRLSGWSLDQLSYEPAHPHTEQRGDDGNDRTDGDHLTDFDQEIKHLLASSLNLQTSLPRQYHGGTWEPILFTTETACSGARLRGFEFESSNCSAENAQSLDRDSFCLRRGPVVRDILQILSK